MGVVRLLNFFHLRPLNTSKQAWNPNPPLFLETPCRTYFSQVSPGPGEWSDSPGLCLPTDSVVLLLSCPTSSREEDSGPGTSSPASSSLASVEAEREEKLILSLNFGLNSDIGRAPVELWTWPGMKSHCSAPVALLTSQLLPTIVLLELRSKLVFLFWWSKLFGRLFIQIES